MRRYAPSGVEAHVIRLRMTGAYPCRWLTLLPREPDLATQVIGHYSNVSDAAIVQKTDDFYSKTASFERSLQPTLPGIKAMMDFLSASVPNLSGCTPEQFVDLRFLNQLTG